MGKKGSGKKRGRDLSYNSTWCSADHAIRKARQQRKNEDKAEERERRTAILTRGSKQKKEESKLRLQIKKVQKEADVQRRRLERYDAVEEKLKLKLEEERRRKAMEEAKNPKRKGRKGPETWKLTGAARPAWEVYDFDTRYVDPHIKALEDHKVKLTRLQNILVLFKGRLGEMDDPSIPQPVCRDFLALLMQVGLLNLQAKNYKSARQAFLECMELDSPTNPITPARCHLMRLYMEANRPDSARKLWEQLSPDDPSVWIRYSAALVEFVSWKILEEEGSNQETAEQKLGDAIRSNVFCAYYLAFSQTFESVMDYVEEIEEAHEGQPLEEAIEYCNSEQMGAWHGTEGALEWVKSIMTQAMAGKSTIVSSKDVEWREKLQAIRKQAQEEKDAQKQEEDSQEQDETAVEENNDSGMDSAASDEDEEDEIDVLMFAGMFETAVEMIGTQV